MLIILRLYFWCRWLRVIILCMDDDDFDTGSNVCFAHMLVDGHVVDPITASDVSRFRTAERARLYELRKLVPPAERSFISSTLSDLLDREIGPISGQKIAVYWPIKGEPNLREWMTRIHSLGVTVALPVVVRRASPVEFHEWTPDCQMRRGFWDIPVPDCTNVVEPDIIVVPLLGVDQNRFRLGNGGGYYDRTLVMLTEALITIGVGHAFSRIKTIFPMPWDVPMDKVILSDGSVY